MTTVCKTPYLDFKCTKSPSGHDWHYVKRTNDTNRHDSAVVITTVVKIDNRFNFLFLKTKRPPISAENKATYCLESPAGLIGDDVKNENLNECINKELLEETGYKTNNIHIELKNSSTSSGLSSETLTYATAIVENNVITKEPVDDGGIICERFFVPVQELYNYLSQIDTKIFSVASATICGIYFAIERMKQLNIL